MKKLLFLVLIVLSSKINAQLCFYTATNYSVTTTGDPKAITSADFNGDGHIDLAIASPHTTTVTPSSVSILLGDGLGGFSALSTFTVVDQPYGICSNDFNGDSKADLAMIINGQTFSGFLVMLGNGAGAFGAPTYSATTVNNPGGIVTADFNADGKKDVAFTDINSVPASALPVYLGNGNGTFTHYTTISIGTGTVSLHPNKISCADINSDSKLDFIVSCEAASNEVYICLGNGLGGVSTPFAYTIGTGSTYNQLGLTLGDFDGNGKTDIVSANGSVGNISVLLNNAAGTGAFTSNNYTAGNNPVAVVGADYDGDGDEDIVVANSSASQVSILLNNGSGVFSAPTAATSFSVGLSPIELVTADFNEDGRFDIASANRNSTSSNDITILLNSLPNAISISGTTTICAGASTVLTATGTTTYTWSANAASTTTSTVSVNPTSNTTYTVTGANTGCSVTGASTVSVTVNALPSLSIVSSSTYICHSNPITLTASGASTYTWTNGITNGVAFTPTAVATYTVNATDINNCTNSATINIGLSVPQVPQICLVTTDSATLYNNNILYWDNTQYTNVDSFLIYRYEALAGSYIQIASVKGDSSMFIDTLRHIVVSGTHITTDGDPNYSSYKYTLAIKDSCGNIGAQSPYHQTVFLQDQHNGNFNLNPYTIGNGQTNPVTGYALYKDATGTGNNFSYLTTITGTSGTDPGYSSTANYRVDILGFNCVTNQRLAAGNNSTDGIRQKAHSNTARVINAAGIKQITSKINVSIYPNPSNGTFSIETNTTTKQTLQLFDISGKLVLSQAINNKVLIDASNLSEGIYNLNISSNEDFINKRIVIVK